jgi:hypothetical protein
LCYYGSQKEKEAKGWIYLKDITRVYDEKKTFTIVSESRSMTLEASSAPEHILWVQALANYYPNASSDLQSNFGSRRQRSEGKDNESSREEPGDSSKSESKQQLPSLFSRYAQGDEKQSFYNQNGAELRKFPVLNSFSEDIEYGDPEITGADQVTSSLDPSNHPLGHISSNSLRNSKEDHRLKSYHGNDSTISTTNRLHKYISKEALPEQQESSKRKTIGDANDELESMVLTSESSSRARLVQRSQDRVLKSRPLESGESDTSSELRLRTEENVLEEKMRDHDDQLEDRRNTKTGVLPKKVIKPAGAIPLPANAPPRRAKDALLEAESSQQKARQSIDEVLFKKSDSRDGSLRNSLVEKTSSDEEEFDIKVCLMYLL